MTVEIDVSRLNRAQKLEYLQILEEKQNRQAQRLFYHLYPEQDEVWTGPPLMGGLVQPGQILYSKDKYPRHWEFLDAGAEFRERCASMGNRCGKTFGLGGYELAAHLCGQYPKDWKGRRFDTPISAWAAGDTYETTRDIIQLTLLGEVTHKGHRKVMDGRGIIPGETLGDLTWRSGVQGLVDTIAIKHVSGGWSQLGLKSYDQGRKSFQGTGRHVIWLDEEPPGDVYNECLIRTATLNGIALLTFTPLSGLSEVVLSFMPANQRPS